MNNYFIVDYDNYKLYMKYNDEMHQWDLTEGDVGDFWHSFKDKHGVERDINFFVDDYDQIPSLLIYELDDDGNIDTSDYEEVPLLETDGDIDNYFSLNN